MGMNKPNAEANNVYDFLAPLFHACDGITTCRTCRTQLLPTIDRKYVEGLENARSAAEKRANAKAGTVDEIIQRANAKHFLNLIERFWKDQDTRRDEEDYNDAWADAACDGGISGLR